MFQKIVLQKMFGSAREEGAGYIMHGEESYEFYSSASIVRVKTSRRIIGQGTSHAQGRT
jgi:hypothetical protein